MSNGSKIAEKFRELKAARSKAVIAFLTAGYPDLELSRRVMKNMEKWGADILEIGVPFSDPIADGPIIQAASLKALENGVTLDGVFALCRELKKTVRIPYLLMGYYNVMYHHGLKRFAAHCADAGVAGVVVPDLPYEESGPLAGELAPYDIDLVQFVTPYTDAARMKRIVSSARGFIYFVSSAGVTGLRTELDANLSTAVRAVKQTTDTPVAVGFGISSPAQARQAARDADGIIVGSYFIRLLAEGKIDALSAAVRAFKDALGIADRGLRNAE